MTGYGRAQKILNGRDITVEIRSVNHRYYEYTSRIPRTYSYIDEKLKALLKTGISRGKVDVAVTINNIEGKDSEIAVNKNIAEGYVSALRGISDELGLKDDLTLSNLIKLPDIFNIQKTPDDEEMVWNDVYEVTNEALEKFIDMRGVEGKLLGENIIEKADYILEMVEKVEELSPQTVENYRNRLYKKLSEVLEDKNIDDQRILTEAAVFSEKIAVDEETVRLRSHISQLKTILESDEAVGRKLDFVVQEINREVNTIGSKAQDLNVTKIVVEMKSEIEKIREQIQNIE
ncbi:MAG: YicC family protein [Ruminococcus flavefaciens]|nr:YicC family protein [Ruminococcus flavefaciens]MCM1360624.1 YicC family protein [Clostridiales bacterium]MCM1435192.1 YicC family protein [Ruminococcus flavefaciens]